MKEKIRIWNYPDKERGFMTLGYDGKRDVIYIRKSNKGRLFCHVGSYTSGYMNNRILDERTVKYLFIKDIPNFKYVSSGFWEKNNNMKTDSFTEIKESK